MPKGMLAAAGCGVTAVGVLFYSSQVAEGVRSGLALCGQTLIPSLFPFMALAVLISRSAAVQPLCRLLGPFCRRWLRLPPSLAPVLLMSFVGGYPTGARMLSGMIKSGEITPDEAQRLLFFAVCPAPSFAIVAVGCGLLGSARVGAVVYGCHLFTALLLGGWQARRYGTPSAQTEKRPHLTFSAALVESTAAAVEGMLSICGFVLLFSALLALLQAVGLPLALGNLFSAAVGGTVTPQTFSAAFCGLLEVTCGVFACGGLGWHSLCFVVPFLVSFGSVSVVCQIAACLRGSGISTARLLRGRLLHALLCTLMAAPLLWQMAPALSAWAQAAQPLGQPASVVSAVGLLGAASLLLLTLDDAVLYHSQRQ